MSGSAGKRKSRVMDIADYPADVLVEPCPHCGVDGGQFCRKKYSGKWVPCAVPHERRVNLAQLGSRFACR